MCHGDNLNLFKQSLPIKFGFKYSNICIFSDLAKFDLDGLQLDMKKMDYRVALQMTHNIMILEIIHRVVVCIFEVRMS